MKKCTVYALLLSVLVLIIISACGNSDSTSGKGSGLDVKKTLKALSATEKETFCQWFSTALKSDKDSKSLECTEGQDTTYVSYKSFEDCSKLEMPDCAVGDAESCVLAAKEDLCKTLSETICQEFIKCSKDSIFKVSPQPQNWH